MRLLLLSLLLVSSTVCATDDADESPQLGLLEGRYDLIGRYTDSGKTYAGTARIERIGKRLRVTREVEGKRAVRMGELRRADPGEAMVFALSWHDAHPMEMVCLIGSDLDNYGRLTCHWGRAGNPHKKPGVEAYFAQEPWQPVLP